MKLWFGYAVALGYFGGLLLVSWAFPEPALSDKIANIVNHLIPLAGLACVVAIVGVYVRSAWLGLALGSPKARAAQASALHLATK